MPAQSAKFGYPWTTLKIIRYNSFYLSFSIMNVHCQCKHMQVTCPDICCICEWTAFTKMMSIKVLSPFYSVTCHLHQDANLGAWYGRADNLIFCVFFVWSRTEFDILYSSSHRTDYNRIFISRNCGSYNCHHLSTGLLYFMGAYRQILHLTPPSVPVPAEVIL